MLLTKLSCPACQTTLRTTQPLPAGKRVKCPKCGTPFEVPNDEPQAVRDQDARQGARPVRRPLNGSPAPQTAAIDRAETASRARPKRPKRKKKTSTNPAILRGVAAVILLVFGVGVGVGAYAWKKRHPAEPETPMSSPDLTVWKAESALLAQFGPEVDVAGYRVRPPLGYEPQQPPPGPPEAHFFAWAGPARPDGTHPMFMVMIAQVPADTPVRTLEENLDGALNGIRRRRQTWSRTAAEHGQVNGREFVRARWSGLESSHQVNMHGVCYIAVEGRTVIEISCQDMEPHHGKALAVGEAAALTFRKP